MAVLTIRPNDEARAVRRGAARAGCRVVSLDVGDTQDGRHAMGHVECPDGWAAARMLVAQALEYARLPGVRDLAMWLRSQAPDDEGFARAVHRFVKEHVRFVREEGEIFQGPGYTLEVGGGDCDDHALLVLSLSLAGGLPAVGAFLHAGGDPTHALAQLCPRGVCQWAETTVDAEYGEHPIAAAKRLGVLDGREDLTKGAVIVAEKDLAPLPVGYVDRNPPETTRRTAADLVRLGFLDSLASAAETGDPTDPVFRAAILAFQLSHPPLVADGLTGPATREAMGDVGTVTSKTAYLSDAFLTALLSWVKGLREKGARVTAEDFLTVWQGESGIDPSRRANVAPDRGGLNGMGSAERAAVGFVGTAEDWLALSPEAQLPYVQRYYELDVAQFAKGDWAALTDAGALYLLTYHPAHITHAGDPSFVLTQKGTPDYTANIGLDFGRKGWIEVGDLAKWMFKVAIDKYNAPKLRELAARLASLGGDVPILPEPVSGLTVAVVLIGATALGGAVAELAKRFA